MEYGHETKTVEAFLRRLKRMTVREWDAAWAAAGAAARDAAWAAAWDAAGAALAPTVKALQQSAVELVIRMVESHD
jgi:hypothetical protein